MVEEKKCGCGFLRSIIGEGLEAFYGELERDKFKIDEYTRRDIHNILGRTVIGLRCGCITNDEYAEAYDISKSIDKEEKVPEDLKKDIKSLQRKLW